MKTKTVQLTVNRNLAEKVFGLYVHGTKEGTPVDLSMFKSWMSFYHEIKARIGKLSKDDQITLANELKAAI